MRLRDFYENVGSSDVKALSFLRDYDLLSDDDSIPPCQKCGGEMSTSRKRDRGGEFRPVLRCRKKGCQTTRSVRSGNRFFHYTDINGRLNSNLKLHEILELVLMFVMEIPMETAVTLTGISKPTIVDWYNMCREVCSSIVRDRSPMIGTHLEPIQIDESRFAGRRKYNRGRILDGDQPAESEDDLADVQNRRNHGRRIDGPWVFGLNQGNDWRYFWVERRDKSTLIPIIQRECAPGSVIHSDEWPAYKCLTSLGFEHDTVNHQENFVDPVSGAHTQSIERSWLDAKVKIMKKMRGVPTKYLQSHLDHVCWKAMRKGAPDLFVQFLRDVGDVYRTSS